jgi:hypothetical protein
MVLGNAIIKPNGKRMLLALVQHGAQDWLVKAGVVYMVTLRIVGLNFPCLWDIHLSKQTHQGFLECICTLVVIMSIATFDVTLFGHTNQGIN